jgi:hypothetical protein
MDPWGEGVRRRSGGVVVVGGTDVLFHVSFFLGVDSRSVSGQLACALPHLSHQRSTREQAWRGTPKPTLAASGQRENRKIRTSYCTRGNHRRQAVVQGDSAREGRQQSSKELAPRRCQILCRIFVLTMRLELYLAL